jgi:serine/threonine protein kinase
MGVVWLAADELLRRDVAIKEAIRPPGLTDEEWRVLRQRSLHEAQAAARLHHPNIVAVYDVLSHDDRPWIVMQLVPYPSLSEVLRSRGPMNCAQAAQLGLCVLAAAQAAFAAGVLHRDIKPANILLRPDGDAVLTDFGIAAADTGAHLTLSGTVVGSPAYMSPERARGEQATFASDMWSLGATLYAAAEGREPFARSSALAVLTAVVSDEPDPPERCGPLWPVISALLRKDPRARLGPDDAERRLAWAASAPAEPDVTGPATAPGASPAAAGGTLADRGRTLRPGAGIALADGHDWSPSIELPAGDRLQRPSRRVTTVWLASGLASIVLIAGIMLTLSLGSGRSPSASSRRAGRMPAAQGHTSAAAPGPGTTRTAAPVLRVSRAPARSVPPAEHVPPGQAKQKHHRHKPKKKSAAAEERFYAAEALP